MCLNSSTFWELGLFKDFLIPIIVALITYYLLKKYDEYKIKKNTSLLGVLIIESIIEEVNAGLTLMKTVINKSIPLSQIPLLPDKSWTGMSTIPDEVLLRIIETSKNISPIGFHPRQIRSHCKNYFYNITSHWKANISSGENWRVNTTQLLLRDKFGKNGHIDHPSPFL